MSNDAPSRDDKYSGHERQVHRRNFNGQSADADGFAAAPPGEYGQYGINSEQSSQEPWYNKTTGSGHSANERDSRYTQWREEQIAQFDADFEDWKKENLDNFPRDFEEWRRKQTAPGTNVGSSPNDRKK